MFQKDQSSIASTSTNTKKEDNNTKHKKGGGSNHNNKKKKSSGSDAPQPKKALDTPLRKTDRKTLFKTVLLELGVQQESAEELAHASFIKHIFVDEGTVSIRKLNHVQLNKVQLYFRSPSAPNVVAESSSSDQVSVWPYTKGEQCIWMTVELERNQVVQVPTVALLSVLVGGGIASYPSVLVPPNVSTYLCRGANLMRAGMIQTLNMSSSQESSSKTMVMVQIQNNPQPFAVGRWISSKGLNDPEKGVGVEIWTCYGDDLWRQQQQPHGSSASSIISPFGGAPFDDGNFGNVGFLEGKRVCPISVVGGDDQETNETAPGGDPSSLTDGNDDAAGAAASPNDEDEEEEPSIDYSSILHAASCQALVNLSDKQLPILSSNFYAQHVLPICSQIAEHQPQFKMELKQTKWKKFGVYLQRELASRDVIQLKADKTNPAASISRIYRRHDDLKGLSKDAGSNVQDKKTKLAVVSLYRIPKQVVTSLRLPEDDVLAKNAKSEARRGTGFLTLAETKGMLDAYVASNDLDRRSKVALDGPLTDTLYRKQRSSAPDQLLKKEMYERWKTSVLEPAYALVEMPGSKVLELHKGIPPKVQLVVERAKQRQDKFITRLRGMEYYGLTDGEALCQDVSRRFACAGKVVHDPTTEKRPALAKKNHVELVFQGHLAEELQALLMGDEKGSSHGGVKNSPYSVPKQVIDVELRKGVSARKKRR